MDDKSCSVELFRFRLHNKVLTDSVLYCTIIVKKSSKHPELVIFENGNELESQYIEKYRNQINKQRKAIYDVDAVTEMMKSLYMQFWYPIQEKLEGIKTVYLSLDGVYNQLNLNTLINPKSNNYLLDEMDLRIVTGSGDLLAHKSEHDSKNLDISNTALLIGDPDFNLDSVKYKQVASLYSNINERSFYDISSALDIELVRSGIAPLPRTRKEIETISDQMEKKGWKVDKKLGQQAVEEAVKSAENLRVLHIATHGKFVKDFEIQTEQSRGFETEQYVENPLLRSFLLFAGAENTLTNPGNIPQDRDDGLLTAYEAQNLNLDNTELVVLSACETGLGEIKNGEGVYGLQRAFQVAGAKTLIMSLWSVNDEATQELMTSFYDKWLSGISKREAFRKSQSELKQKYIGFYYWGAFVMVGE